MALCFSPEKFAAHQAGAIQKMQVLGLDSLLMFKQESMFFRTVYGTFGFCCFQCLYLGTGGLLMLLART